MQLTHRYFRLLVVFFGIFFVEFTSAADISVMHAYARATPPGVKTGAAYMQLRNHTGSEITFVSVQSKQVPTVEFHHHRNVNGTMHMEKVDKILVPANGEFRFEPGQYHIMLMGLTAPLVVGDKIGLQLKRANGETVDVVVPIKAVGHEMIDHKAHGAG
jgi:hypothetical protein